MNIVVYLEWIQKSWQTLKHTYDCFIKEWKSVRWSRRSEFPMSRASDQDPDPVWSGVFAWIRIGFNPRIPEHKEKECRKGSKSYLLQENSKTMTKDRQKMKRQKFLFKNHQIFNTEVSGSGSETLLPTMTSYRLP